jgi:hypothetical protein
MSANCRLAISIPFTQGQQGNSTHGQGSSGIIIRWSVRGSSGNIPRWSVEGSSGIIIRWLMQHADINRNSGIGDSGDVGLENNSAADEFNLELNMNDFAFGFTMDLDWCCFCCCLQVRPALLWVARLMSCSIFLKTSMLVGVVTPLGNPVKVTGWWR